ncbi:MAG: flagellar hook-length control protein FliK [Candidatus Thiodiazotropha lotti]|nr:flagellar hook-length control protein FliK [Candidatus Thiodiazotropha lotti]
MSLARNLLVICRQETTLTGNAMAQIPFMPQMTGGNTTSTKTGEADLGLISLSAESLSTGIPFDLALQELLASEYSEEALQLFSLQMPMDTEAQPMTNPMLTQDGKLLPLTPQLNGQTLPQLSELSQQPLAAKSGELTPVLTLTLPQKVQTEVALPKLTSLVTTDRPVEMMSLINTDKGGDRALSEVSRPADSGNQFSLNALNQSATSPLGSRASIVLPLNTPVGQPGWDQAVGERIQWMVNQNIQQAEIKLTPPNLGPLEIKISLQNDQTNVTFIAAQAPTREALESSIPRLREMFGEINLNLANVDVGHQQAGEPGREGAAESQGRGGSSDTDSSQGWSADSGSVQVRSGDGLLDTYA